MDMSLDELHGSRSGAPRPTATDGRIDVLAQARIIDGSAIGELFVDLADGSVVVVVVRQDAEGEVRVEITNREERAPLDVFVNGEQVHERLPF
jgi:hypothetical protein